MPDHLDKYKFAPKQSLRAAANAIFAAPDCHLKSSVFICNEINDSCEETITATTVRVWRRRFGAPKYDQKSARRLGIEQPVEITVRQRINHRTRRNTDLLAGWK